MRIGHLELVSGKTGKVQKVKPIHKTDGNASDEQERQRQKRLARWIWLDSMNEKGHVLKLYDAQGRIVDVVDAGHSIGCSMSVKA